MQRTISITVKGKVQGVFFRKHTREKALETGISGMGRNEKDGSVYIIATGSDLQIDEFVSWCKQGPSRAKVDTVEVQNIGYRDFTGFTIEKK